MLTVAPMSVEGANADGPLTEVGRGQFVEGAPRIWPVLAPELSGGLRAR